MVSIFLTDKFPDFSSIFSVFYLTNLFNKSTWIKKSEKKIHHFSNIFGKISSRFGSHVDVCISASIQCTSGKPVLCTVIWRSTGSQICSSPTALFVFGEGGGGFLTALSPPKAKLHCSWWTAYFWLQSLPPPSPVSSRPYNLLILNSITCTYGHGMMGVNVRDVVIKGTKWAMIVNGACMYQRSQNWLIRIWWILVMN